MDIDKKVIYIVIIAIITIITFFFGYKPAQARVNVEINKDECKVVEIQYTGVNSYIHTKGYCADIYKMCAQDKCPTKDLDIKDLDFSKKVIGGVKVSTE